LGFAEFANDACFASACKCPHASLITRMRTILSIFLFAALGHAQMELDGVRGKVLSYNTDGQNFTIRDAKGAEHRLRWTSASKLADKKRRTDFSSVANRGQDASFLLGYGWRDALANKELKVQRGYLYNTQGEKKTRLPNTESAVITGVLRPTGDDSGILTVNGTEYTVTAQPNSSFISVQPTIAASIFRSTEDVRIWASRIDGEFFVHQMEFYSGDWPSTKAPPPKPKQTITSGLPGHELPKEIRHAPAEAKGNGFTRTISKDFGGTLPKAAKVIKRKTFNNNNNRNNNGRNNNNNRNRNKKRR
jgi:hypothetical protein